MGRTHPLLANEEFLRLSLTRRGLRQTRPALPPDWHAMVRRRLRQPHPEQQRFIVSPAKRKVIRAGRRGGKTVGVALIALHAFLAGQRVLYAVPTQEQVNRFWFEVKRALEPAIDQGAVLKNETRHSLEIPRTETAIRAKTAWDANTLRGDYADVLILDEHQLMSEDAWGLVGAPMLLDNNGDAVFVYTPPSILSMAGSKAKDKRHAAKLFAAAAQDTSGRWAVFHFASHANPHVSVEALEDISKDMTHLAYLQEIAADDVEEVPGALWTLRQLDANRVTRLPELVRLIIAIDPGHEAGIIAVGLGEDGHGYVLEDLSVTGDPDTWARQAVAAYHKYQASAIIPERNHGGEMVETTIKHVDRLVTVKTVWASHGKYARAEPISVKYAQGAVHHVGVFPELEEELCTWVPGTGQASPNRLDAVVWGLTELLLTDHKRAGAWGRG